MSYLFMNFYTRFEKKYLYSCLLYNEVYTYNNYNDIFKI